MQKFKLKLDDSHNELLPYMLITSSDDLLKYINLFAKEDDWYVREYFYMVGVNNRLEVVFFDTISIGGLCGTVVDTRLVLANAILSLSTGIMLAHNHPSGNMNPSEPDNLLNSKLKKALDCVDINLLDHIVLHPSKNTCISIF